METQTGTLYVVSTPIGNADDISLRAIKILKLADVVVCEEGKVGARLMHQLRLAKTIEELHEHNEAEQTPVLLAMLAAGKTLALISDAGTPLLADPGLELVQQAVQKSIPVVAAPGASSIMTALVTSGLPVHQFIFAGFLSRDSDDRVAQLRELASETRTVVLLETPYRLLPLLEAAVKVMPERRAFLGCNLTMTSETRHYGTVAELLEKFSNERFKGEFVFVFAGTGVGRTAVRSEQADGGMEVPRRRIPLRAPRSGAYSQQDRPRRSSEGEKREPWKGKSEGEKRGPWKGKSEGEKRGPWKGKSEGEKREPWKGKSEGEKRGGLWKSREGERPGRREGGYGRSTTAGKPGGFRGRRTTPGDSPDRRK